MAAVMGLAVRWIVVMKTQIPATMTEPAARATATMIARLRGMNVRNLTVRRISPAIRAIAPTAQPAMMGFSV